MAFLQFPVFFSEEDYDKKEELGLPCTKEPGIMTINTNLICGYNENSNTKNTMLRMASGDVIECPLKITEFEKHLSKIELLITVNSLTEN